MEITIYSNNNCSRCKTAKQFLSSQNIPYIEVNIDDQPEAKDFLVSKNLSALPVFVINNSEPRSILTIPELATLLS